MFKVHLPAGSLRPAVTCNTRLRASPAPLPVRQSLSRMLALPDGQEDMPCASSQTYDRQLQAAIQAVSRACSLCIDTRRAWSDHSSKASGNKLQKQDRTPVTVADFAVQALVALELQAMDCDEPLVAEEDAMQLRRQGGGEGSLHDAVVGAVASHSTIQDLTSDQVLEAIDFGHHQGEADRFWILDPIDGTVGFLQGGDCQYTVGLGLVEDGEVVAGCMGLPNWSLPVRPSCNGGNTELSTGSGGILVYAAKGMGTWVRRLDAPAGEPDVRVQVDPTGSLHEPYTLCISDHETYDDLPMAASLGDLGRPEVILPLCCGSLCKYAAVAVGSATAFIQHPVKGFPRLKAWDHAAGVICVLEAGGQVSDLHDGEIPFGGGAIDFVPGGGGVSVTNRKVHDALLAAAIGAGMWWRGPPLPVTELEAISRGKALQLPFLVCIDRDGVINEDIGAPGVTRVEDFHLVPGAAKAIAALNKAGAHVCVVTNQSAVGKGLLTPQGLVEVHNRMKQYLSDEGACVDGILVACDTANRQSRRRKPGPGMLEEAMTHFGVGPSRTIFIGDALTDMQAAAAAGIPRRVLVTTGRGSHFRRALEAKGQVLPVTSLTSGGQVGGLPPEVVPVTVHADLSSAVKSLLDPGSLSPGSS
mmetsp:Transcript_34236/g.97057  ORF Transcript_34236/g.97057 Transcript_34236/m.97057 type:complete len:641 (+) Transcript_34236:160-2082(+)